MTSRQMRSLAARYLRAKARAKAAYAEADAALLALSALPPDTVIELPNVKLQLVDQFATRATVFKACGIQRFALKEVS